MLQPDDPLTQELAKLHRRKGGPYRTVRDLARVEGITSQLLYGTQQVVPSTQSVANTQKRIYECRNRERKLSKQPQTESQPGLVDLATIYSLDASTEPQMGAPLVNINTADEQQLTQIETQQGQPVFFTG